MCKLRFLRVMVFGAILTTMGSCISTTPPINTIAPDILIDGTYEGEYHRGPVFVVARVTVAKQRIEAIELLKHTTWRGGQAERVILGRIIKHQSASADAVTGATVSSHVIMHAVNNALQKASK